jgi:hypothetical protein
MRRGFRHAALLLALCATTAMPAHAEWRGDTYVYTVADSEAALADAGPLARCIVRHEDADLDPYAVGNSGERGVAQLLPGGMLDVFYSRGYSTPWSPYESVAFLEDALARGEGHFWSTYGACRWG